MRDAIPALKALVHRWHERLVGTGIGERTRVALHGIAWVGSTAMVARVLTGVTSLLTARAVGPDAWGLASLALAASLWLQIPLLAGLPTAIFNTVPRVEAALRSSWARTGSLLLFATGALTLAAGVLLREPLARLGAMGVPEFNAGLTWCAGFLIYSTAVTLLASMERFRARALAELLFAIAFASGVLALHLTDRLSWQGYVFAMACGYAVAGGAMFAFARAPLPSLAPGTAERARHLLGFGLIAAGSSVAIALVHAVGRQVMNVHFAVDQVGLLSAYQGGSLMLAVYLQGVLTVVFFPVAARTPDRRGLFRKVTRLLLPVSAVASVGFAAILTAWMFLLGRQYPVDPVILVVFAIAAGLTTAFGSLAWALASGGRAGVAAATVTWLAAGAGNLAACLLLIPSLGVLGAGLAAIAGALAGIGASFLPVVRRWASVA